MINDDNVKEPIVAQNLSDTNVVNVGEEIADNTVQKEQLTEENAAQESVNETANEQLAEEKLDGEQSAGEQAADEQEESLE